MGRKIFLLAWFLICAVLPAWAQIQKFCIPGVAPSRHVTSLEFSPGVTVVDNNGSVSVNSLTSKLYYAFTPDYNVGIEVP